VDTEPDARPDRHLTHILRAGGHAGHERSEGERVARGRQRIDQGVIEDLLLLRVLHVHDRRFAGDGNRLLDRADRQLCVDGRRERTGQLDRVTPDRVEPREREGDGVGSRPKLDDAVVAGAVGHGDARFFDQRRAGRFDGDTGQHGARRIPHDPGDARLSVCGGRHRKQTSDQRDRSNDPHSSAPLMR
jgi:hypothetical protein